MSKRSTKKATFAAGCFWGVQEEFNKLIGVIDTTVGFMGGHLKEPSYEEVLTDRTGHAEVVELNYDENVLSYEEVLVCFFNLHNPSTIPGTKYKYRTTIFYHDEEQEEIAKNFLQELKANNPYEYEIKTTVVKAGLFYKAEEYHQNYYKKLDK